MNRWLPLLAVACLLVPAATVQAQYVPGDYPDPVEDAVEGILADGPGEEEAGEQARPFLDEATEELDSGNASMAIENYVFYRVAVVEEELASDLADRGEGVGQDIADRRLERIVREGRATVDEARAFLEDLEFGDLSKQGLDTALWGAVLLARGEMQLNIHDQQLEQRVYSGDELDRTKLGAHVGAAMGGSLMAAIGLEIASRAPHVEGDPLDPEMAHERVSQAANISIEARGSQVPDYLPEATLDESPIVRTGLVHVTIAEVRLPEFQRAFGQEGTADTLDAMERALRFDHERLAPFAEAGFPYAKAGFEATAFAHASQLENPARFTPQRAHAHAIATTEIQKTVFPNATEAEETSGIPAAGALSMLAALGAAAVAARRRRR